MVIFWTRDLKDAPQTPKLDPREPNFPSRNVKITPTNPSLRYRPDPQIGGQNRQGGVATPTPPRHPLLPEKPSNLGGTAQGGVFRCNFDKKGGEGGGGAGGGGGRGGVPGTASFYVKMRKVPSRRSRMMW